MYKRVDQTSDAGNCFIEAILSFLFG